MTSEGNELTQLNSAYNSLIAALGLEKTKLFNTDYKIFDILVDEGIWEGRPLNSERMETAIKSLHKNLKVLKIEQEEEIKSLQNKFGKENINLNPTSQELQEQIKVKKIHLEPLINSAKEKLKSNSKFLDAKRQEREKKLETFFKNFPADQEEFKKSLENIKEGLNKRLTEQEISNLCRVTQELKQLQLNLQTQQTPQIIQPPYGSPSSSGGNK